MTTRNKGGRRTLLAFAALALGLVLATSAGAAEITEDDVVAHIAAAKTAEDHEAIAAYFRGKAARQAEQVKLHEAMLAAYDRQGGKQYGYMTPHCRTIIAELRELEEGFLAMAKEHEALAKNAGK
jgi:hypothetical protein